MKTLAPNEYGKEEIAEYLKDWRPGREFLKELGYRVYAFDPDFSCCSPDGGSFSVPRQFIDKLLERGSEKK